jgi:hypothetical protein
MQFLVRYWQGRLVNAYFFASYPKNNYSEKKAGRVQN